MRNDSKFEVFTVQIKRPCIIDVGSARNYKIYRLKLIAIVCFTEAK